MLETQFYFIFDKYEVELYIANHSILNYTYVKAYVALLLCLLQNKLKKKEKFSFPFSLYRPLLLLHYK